MCVCVCVGSFILKLINYVNLFHSSFRHKWQYACLPASADLARLYSLRLFRSVGWDSNAEQVLCVRLYVCVFSLLECRLGGNKMIRNKNDNIYLLTSFTFKFIYLLCFHPLLVFQRFDSSNNKLNDCLKTYFKYKQRIKVAANRIRA